MNEEINLRETMLNTETEGSLTAREDSITRT
jgi:hypothetical protein